MGYPLNTPDVSVIIPAYNASGTLSEAIDSVLNQTYIDLECIVVNDGSVDRTEDIVLSYLDPRLVYHVQENRERSIARNVGASMSRGRYLAFLDADDVWLPDKLERQIQLLKSQDNLGLVYCDVMYFDAGTGQEIGSFSLKSRLERGMVFEKLLWEGNFIQSPTPVLRKEAYERVGGYDPSLIPLEDWDLWLRIARLYPVDFVPEPLARYRWRPETVSLTTPGMKVHNSYLRLLKKVETQFCQENRSLRWKVRFLRFQAVYRQKVAGRRQIFQSPAGMLKA